MTLHRGAMIVSFLPSFTSIFTCVDTSLAFLSFVLYYFYFLFFSTSKTNTKKYGKCSTTLFFVCILSIITSLSDWEGGWGWRRMLVGSVEDYI